MNYLFLIQVILITNVFGMVCNYYPLDQVACVLKTKGISCQFNYFENACVETKSTNLGCISNLNQQACLQQQRNIDGKEVKCFFRKRCIDANQFHLKNLDCDSGFSIYGCVNIYGKNCIWTNKACVTYNSEIIKGESCEKVFQAPVTPGLCAQIQDLGCYNNGFQNGYFCQTVSEQQLQQFTCDALGLNKDACVAIRTKGQRCIFINNICREFQLEDEISCLSYLNKEACLSISNPALLCVWNNLGCQNNKILSEDNCEILKDVNPSVCRVMPIYCYYDEVNHQCLSPNSNLKQTCTTKGLNEAGCLSIKNQKCIYISKEGCSELGEDQLNKIGCTDSINEEACINITTPFQYCQWDGQKCRRIPLNQDLDCPLPEENGQQYQVNGNVCQAISKQNIGCKYNLATKLCEKSTGQEICTTPYLNLSACVQITQAMSCRWSEEINKCEIVEVIDQVTKCTDLKYSNPLACSQISEFTNNKAIGCYFNSNTQQCEVIIKENLAEMECLQQGLNKYGCTMITKVGQRCRWFRGQCTSIKSKEQIAQISCIELQYVNPGTCALVTFSKEVCKYNTNGNGCVNSINSSDTGDYCNTLGLNSYACSQITRNSEGCYFDKINNVCVLAPDKTSSDESVQAASYLLLNTAKCLASSPTQNICISIETLGEQCAWNSRSNACEYQYVQFNEKCLDYNTAEKQKTIPGIQISVNANVCASILMSYPNKDPTVITKIEDPLRGYCQFDGKGNCIKFLQTPCVTKCCTELVGINAHVCSRFTTGYYCYFNEFNKCVELSDEIVDTSAVQAVKDFYNFKQYKCSSMNKNSCWMLDWSPTQQCYWDGFVCTQINLSDYSKFTVGSGVKVMNKYGCQAIEGDKVKTYVSKYYKFLYGTTCIPSIVELTTCETEGINSNACLGLSPTLYCKWDKINLQCVTIDDYLTLYTCNEFQNKKACINNPYSPCAFLTSTDKCITSPQDIKCSDFNAGQPYEAFVNQKACQNITKSGQICEFISTTNKCQAVSKAQQQSCDLPGINSIGCYFITTANCRWDPINLNCYEEGDVNAVYNLQCNQNINKLLCLTLLNDNCEWSITDMKCSQVEQLGSIKSNTYYNAQACTNLQGDAYYFTSNSGNTITQCQILTTFNNKCTDFIMNKQACLLNTRGHRCFFDQNQSPENKCQNYKEEQIVCSSLIQINIEICMNIPTSCLYEESSLSCKPTKVYNTDKCSTLIVQGMHFNKMACSSIGRLLSDKSTNETAKVCSKATLTDKAQQCLFEKYCSWDDNTYGCILQPIVKASYDSGGYSGPDGQQSNPQCSLSPAKIKCQHIYSAAVCLEFGDGCYFDINQGGCNSYTPNLYKAKDCSLINGSDCTSSKTPNAYCSKIVNAADLTDGCEQDALNQDFCENDQNVTSQSCSDLSASNTASECAQASDVCYLNASCVSPQSYDGITCKSSGVSKTLCLLLNPPCDFSSGSCTPLTIPTLNSDGENYYFLCNEVNLLTTNKSEYVCANIAEVPCKYQLNQCQNAFFEQCSGLLGVTVSALACIQCQGFPVAYDYNTYQCKQITDLSSNCDLFSKSSDCQADLNSCYWDGQAKKCQINLHRLNRQSCALLTTDILAIWDTNTNLCEIQSQSQIQNVTECSVLSRKACLIPSLSCWINSTTLLCEDVTQILATCQQINDYGAQKQHCVVSNLEPCKWVTSCVPADLTVDNCTGLNRYACLNIQQKLNCAWSDYDKRCDTISPILNWGCNYYFWGYWYFFQVNPYICSQQIVGNCYLDTKSHRCTSVGTKDIYCSQNKGINQMACLTSTKDSCKFDTASLKCIPTPTSDQQCSDLANKGTCCLSSLNQVACLSMPNAYCKFYQNVCSTFLVLDKTTIDAAIASSLVPDTQHLSPNICDYFNKNIVGAYFIYDTVRLQCIFIDKPSPSKYFALCRSISISQKGCLEKTMDYCYYDNNSCQSMSLDIVKQQTECSSAYNWKTCISINALCKFQGGQCVPLGITDTCFNITSAIVGPQVCSQFPTPCKYNTLTYSCIVVTVKTEACSALGISKSACLSYTLSSFCIFDASNFKCTSTYDTSIPCTDTNVPKRWFINQAKCQFIKTPGNYCQFTPPGDNGECLDIPNNLLTGACLVPNVQTNPITCRIATNQVCFYNQISKKCATGDVNVIPWSLGLSFNKQACLKYNHPLFQVKLIWDDDKGCIELSINDLANIQCASPINRLACVSITNPTSFCQFNDATSKCEAYDYIIPPQDSKACASLINVNRYEFCQYASDSCVYNSYSRNCIDTAPMVNSVGDCFNLGMSKTMCNTFPTFCQFNDERRFCYGGNIFCKDNTSATCKNVHTEPCQIINDTCEGISFQDLNTLDCQNAVNQMGCTSIINPQKICQYDIQTSTCSEIIVLTNPCASYTNVNTSKACEFTNDTACKFDFSSKSCKVVSLTDVFECDRGLNYLACSTYTRPSLQCKFGKYCYGPTTGIQACSDSLNKEVCLNFQYFCTWDFQNSLCIDYNLNGQTCQQLQDQNTIVSSQVCYNAEVSDGNACVFDVYTFTCKIIKPNSCFELESQQQCKSQTELPCIWLNGACQLFQAVSTDTCSNVGSLGSKNACLSIFRKGQFCEYQDFNCLTYKENYDADNCLNNINKIACTSQQTSSCIWKAVQKEFQQVQMQLGSCEKFETPNNQDCSSVLSYKSCLSISKYGQNCRWINAECQSIEQQAGIVINYNTYQLINQNACGLVNQDKVRFQEETNSCQLIKDNEIITCKCGKETKGLNKAACLSIVNENCRWIPTQSRCAEYLSLCDIK